MQTSPLPAALVTQCSIHNCRPGCGLEVIDQLLQITGKVRGDEVDALLDLRFLLRHRRDAEAALALFCQLRRTMEERHYLAFYRLRRWLENHLESLVRIGPQSREQAIPIQLRWYCVEAIRHQCLRAATPASLPSDLSGRVQFAFRTFAPSEAASERVDCGTLPS